MNKKIVTGALAALTIGGVALAAATPAAAQHYGYRGGGYYHGGRGVGVGTAVGAGLLGLAVGSAIADRPYYGGGYGYYGYGPGYYAPAPYFYPGYGYYYGGRYWHHYGHGRYW